MGVGEPGGGLMGRHTKVITIGDEGRDKGKTFLLTEMAASQAEKWAMRALLAVGKSGIDIPDYIAGTGMAGLAVLGIKAMAGVTFAEAEPLMDEMMACVRIIPDIRNNPDFTRVLIEDDIEEVATRVRLRSEVFALHTGFFLPGIGSTSTSEIQSQESSNTKISRAQSAR